jgi:hypothetical protein
MSEFHVDYAKPCRQTLLTPRAATNRRLAPFHFSTLRQGFPVMTQTISAAS